MPDTSLGFRYRGRKSGGQPTIQDLLYKDTETLTRGDMVNLETGEIDLGATADTNFLGMVQETQAGTDSTTRARVIVDSDAIYGVYDPNARVKGATLDIAGATGAQTIAASSNKEFVVFAESTATEETLVCFNTGKHHDNKAQ
jgi:methionine aminopeptidase